MTDTNNPQTSPALDDCSRRSFLKGGVLAAAVPAVSVAGFYAGYKATRGNPLRVGVIGTGEQGQVLMTASNPKYIDIKSIADIRPYNIHRAFHGDSTSPAAYAKRRGLLYVNGWGTIQQARKNVSVYTDYRELIQNAKKDGIEAVIIALPLHLHAHAAIYAMRRGLHVFTERLMGHTVAECKEMARVAQDTRKHLATGHQRHYNILYQEAVDTIRRGVLGNVHYIRAQWHQNNLPGNDTWRMPMPRSIKVDDPRAAQLNADLVRYTRELALARGLAMDEAARRVAQTRAQIADYILGEEQGGEFLGLDFQNAESRGYQTATLEAGGETFQRPSAEELLRWRLWQRTGSGLMTELGSHQVEAAAILLTANNDYYLDRIGSNAPRGKRVRPLNVYVSANRNIFGIDRQISDHVTALIEYPAPDYDDRTLAGRKRKICMQYSTINGNGFGGYGEIVFGMDGTIILTSEIDMELLRAAGAGTRVEALAADAAMLDTQDSGPAQQAVGGAGGEVSRGFDEQLQHWAWCIRRNPRARQDRALLPRCHPQVALEDAVTTLVTNIAADTGQSIEFRDEWFDIESDATPEWDYIAQDREFAPNVNKEKYNV